MRHENDPKVEIRLLVGGARKMDSDERPEHRSWKPVRWSVVVQSFELSSRPRLPLRSSRAQTEKQIGATLPMQERSEGHKKVANSPYRVLSEHLMRETV